MGATGVFCIQCGASNPLQAKFCFSCGEAINGQEQAGTARATDVTAMFSAIKIADATGQLKTGEILRQRYKVLKQIGQGGFGAVYKAEDQELGQRLLAVKEMGQQHLSPQELSAGVEAFKHEALMLAGLRHEHLPRIYDHFMENERWYLVMDYIEGETLEERFAKSRDGSLPLMMALKIALQLCDVLDYLHTRKPPIIFRDLKPANVILTLQDDVFLIDFGIARHFKPGQARDTIAFGSPGYAAPEQYGKTQTTPRADIYSLGALLHQMLSGVDPSLSPFRFASLTGHDPALQHLVTRMLEMDEVRRPGSIGEVRRVLQRVQERPIVPAHATVHAGQLLPAMPAALQLPTISAAQGPVPVVLHKHHYGVVRAVAWSPDSQCVASATEAIIRVWDVSWNTSVSQNVCSYREHLGEIKHMAWSPNSMRIASVSEENTVRIWDANSGKTINVYRGDPDLKRNVARVLAWSSDGQLLAAGGSKYVYLWETTTGRLLAKLRGGLSSWCSALSWAPRTRVFAAALGKKVMICNLDPGPSVAYYRYNEPINVVAWSPDGKYLACGGADRTVHVWNMQTARLQGIYREHIQPISALSWSPDSRKIVSGSFASNINVWDALTGADIISYQAHAGSVLTVAWSPDGRSILSGGADRRVCVWKAP